MKDERPTNGVPTAVDATHIDVLGARVHNLKNIDVRIPRDRLVVITGLSGSGKSSLAFDTIHAEGQRRYIETFNAYARQFLGGIERPDVDLITGLSPVIAIEQKTISRNPRSTVGTVTEIYDLLRLLYARASEAFSYVTGEPMVRYTDGRIVDLLLKEYEGKELIVLAPLVRGRKGHYRELFEQLQRQGFLRVRVDGQITDLTSRPKLDRYKVHDIELVIDRFKQVGTDAAGRKRLAESCGTAMKQGKGHLMVTDGKGNHARHLSRHLMCPTSGISYEEPEPNLFSFNSPYGACPRCSGLGQVTEVALEKIVPDRTRSVKRGAIAPLGAYKSSWVFKQVEAVLLQFGHTLDTPVEDMEEAVLGAILNGMDEPLRVSSSIGLSDKMVRFDGIIPYILDQAEEGPKAAQKWAEGFTHMVACPECHGARLKKTALHFRVAGANIHDLASMPMDAFHRHMSTLMPKLNEKQAVIARDVVKEIAARSKFLLDVGLEYLTLDRSARSLSGGEAQRIRLATQIGSQLTGVLYILDEPSIGLHQRDDHRLIASLRALRDGGNSVLVVEHDKEMMLNADHVIDLGPGAGEHGGRVVAEGGPADLLKSASLTARYIRGEVGIPVPPQRRKGNGQRIVLRGASGNNLKNVELELPLGKFICVTGVSGSGKSTLIGDTLYPILQKHFFRSTALQPLAYRKIEGLEHIDKVIEVDQSPIGRTPRSNPATYTGLFDGIRQLYVQLPGAKIRGYKPGRFSFNTAGGRCETCKGAGVRVIEMNFLPDVAVPCETCRGKRYDRETLEVRFKGKSIADVLDMSVEDALVLFAEIPSLARTLRTLSEVGLGYVRLGQSSTTLSGGEAQRIKLATELTKRDTGRTLYILDEPTTGLHFEDVRQLIAVLDRLVDHGNTVLVIEHMMDMVKVADHVIDLGPEGGEGGGRIVARGTPEEVALMGRGHTASFLDRELRGATSHGKATEPKR